MTVKHKTASSESKPVNILVENLTINIILAIYTFILAIAVPVVVISALTIGGQQFSVPLYTLMVAGVFGVILAVIALIATRHYSMQTTGHVLAIIGTIMTATGALMVLFFILTPLLLVADWFLLHPQKRFEEMTINILDEKQIVVKNDYELEKERLRRMIASGNVSDVQLPFSFYFDNDFIPKLIPTVVISTAGVYISIWFTTRGRAQSGSTLPMFLSMMFVLVVFAIVDIIIWLLRKRVARPIMTLEYAGIYYRKHHQQFFVPWADIINLTNVTVPSGQTRITCLFVFVKNPEKYIDTSLQLSHKKEKLERWLHGIRPEYFQNEFAGVALTIPIDRLGIEPQNFLNIVTKIWKQNINAES